VTAVAQCTTIFSGQRVHAYLDIFVAASDAVGYLSDASGHFILDDLYNYA
jgi:hypothetical protein